MSWYVQQLIRTSIQLRDRIHSVSYENFEQIEEVDLEDFDYNNLLLVEEAVQKLLCIRQFTKRDLAIVGAVSSGKSFPQLEKELGKTRITLGVTFQRICNRLAFHLGGYFTDSGYMEYLKHKYKLDNQKLNSIKVYIESRKIV
jgi:hypothetical protein